MAGESTEARIIVSSPRRSTRTTTNARPPWLNPWVWGIAAAVIGMIVLSGLLVGMPLDRDEGAFLVISQGILHGRLPYRDYFDHKSPGIYYLLAALLALVGRLKPSEQALFLREVVVAVNALTGIGLFVVGRRWWRFEVGVLAGFLWLAALPLYAGNQFFTETFMAAAVVWAAALAQRVPRVQGASDAVANRPISDGWSALSAGALLALATLFKQTAIVEAPALLLLIALSSRTARSAMRNLAVFAAAAIAPWLVVLALFARAGGLQPLLADVIVANFTSYPAWPAAKLLYNALYWFDQFPFVWGVAALFVVIVCVRSARARRWPSLGFVASAGFALLGFLPCLNRIYLHYFLQPLPWVALLAAAGITSAIARAFPTPWPLARATDLRAWLLPVAIASMVTLTVARGDIIFTSNEEQGTARQASVGAWIERQTPTNARVLIGPAQPEYYFLAQRTPPAHYVYLQTINQSDYAQAVIDLDAQKFDYVVWDSNMGGPHTEYAAIYAAISAHYQPIARDHVYTTGDQAWVLYRANR